MKERRVPSGKTAASRKQAASGKTQASRVLKKYVRRFGMALVCAVVLLGIWQFSRQAQVKETENQKAEKIPGEQEEDGEAGEIPGRQDGNGKTEEAAGNPEEKSSNSAVGQEPGHLDREEGHQPTAVDAVSSIEPQQSVGFSDIQAMAAGDILDVSALSKELLDSLFYSEAISEQVRQRIINSSYRENENISLEELRYLRVLHIGFDGETHIGEMIVNQEIAEDILEIMSELYKQEYPIEKMALIDAYGADDESSMSDNNTSAFNYREIAGSSKLSRHALGLAVDINPKYNPYVKEKNGEYLVSPANGAAYADRSQEFPYKIAEGDLCLRLFLEHGFTWGGSWNSVKDYQHFER